MKKAAIFLLKLAVTFGVLAWLLSKVELGTVAATVRRIPAPMLVVATALTLAQPLLAALRWHLILHYLESPIRFARTLLISWMGLFASALLPSGIAIDGIRMWLLARTGMRPSRAVHSVLLDRAAALAGLLLLVGACLPAVDDRVASAPVRYGLAAVLIGGLAAGLTVALCIRIPSDWHHFRVARIVAALLDDLRAVCRPWLRALALAGISAFAIACNSLTIFFLLRSLDVQVGVSDVMVLAPIVILAMTLPISLGGWGLREGSMVGLLGMIGVAPAISLSVSILIGLIGMIISLPGALVWLQWRHTAETKVLAESV
jgi:glycosyltransferase 2 family protein